MALDSIIAISEAEERAKNAVADASAQAQRAFSECRSSLEEEYSRRVAEAEAEAERILAEAGEDSEAEAKRYLDTLANKCAIAAVKAEGRFDEAIGIIIRKVVEG